MERITRFRVGVVLLVFFLILGIFSMTLYDMQIIQTGGKTEQTGTGIRINKIFAVINQRIILDVRII